MKWKPCEVYPKKEHQDLYFLNNEFEIIYKLDLFRKNFAPKNMKK